jgi:Glycogen recognition site of AMP-activated protein kinase
MAENGTEPTALATVVTPFEYRAREGATDVQLAGDWCAWAPAPMARMGDDTWALDVALKPGQSHFKFVVDHTWCTSPMYDTVDDGQGGLNNVRVVAADGPKDTPQRTVSLRNGGDQEQLEVQEPGQNPAAQLQDKKKEQQADCVVM